MPEKVVAPRFRGFICTAAHPDGCAANVAEQIKTIQASAPGDGLKRVLVLGASTGYGLSSLLTSVFGYGADAVAVSFEKEPDERRTGTAGWYNVAAAIAAAKDAGRTITGFNGDAFSHAMRDQVIAALKEAGPVDLVVYSLASPKRKDPDSDTVFSSVLKPIGGTYTGKSIDLRDNTIGEVSIDPASDEEVANTVKVMGGEDWALWINALADAGVLAAGCRTVAYSYIGPEVTFPIYRSGTIGKAKEDLEATGKVLNAKLAENGGGAWVSVNKALVTQASSAIPVVPLYISLLFKVMKEKGTHEGTCEQIVRLFKDHLNPSATPQLDDEGRIRIDDWEMAADVQAKVDELWPAVSTENFAELADFEGYTKDFQQLFGFSVPGIDYEAPTEILLSW